LAFEPGILNRDLQLFKNKIKNISSIDGLIVPVPKNLNLEKIDFDKKYNYISIVTDDIEYDSNIGLYNEKN
jgi:hypothetical protein